MLEDNKQESQLLGEEVDQLKLLLKREVSLMKEGGVGGLGEFYFLDMLRYSS